MDRFVIKLLVGVTLIVVAVASVCVGIYFPTDGRWTKDSYQKGFVYQVRALENAATNAPKVLIMGGSYMTFAMDMPFLRKQMDMPSYALGVHSGMGQSYTFEIAEDFVHAGDMVVFVFAGFSRADYGMPLIYQTLDGEDDLLVAFFKTHPFVAVKSIFGECSRRLLRILSGKTLSLLWRARDIVCGRRVAKTTAGNSPPNVYCSSSFDPSTGDLVFHRICEYKKGQKKARVKFDVNAIDPSCFEVINDFYRLCKMRGADMVIAFPPYVDDYLVRPVADLDRYGEELQTKLLPKIVGRQKSSIYQTEMMHGGPMHLNSRGARCYTEQLIKDIMTYCETSKR